MRRGPGDHIRAMRITDMILPAPKVAEPDTPAIRRHRTNHIKDAIDARDHHECQFGEPGVCEDCTRKRKPKRGSARYVRIVQARRKRDAEINAVAQPLDNPPPA